MQKVKLEDVAEILDNRRVPITASERIKGVYPYYGANGIQDYVNGYIFDDELVLLAEDGGYFGSETKPIAYRVSGKCWVNNHAHVLKAKECINVDYLCYSLMFYDVTSFVNGATRQKLTQKDMRNMLIPLRNFEEQIKIVNTLNLIRDLIEKRKKQIEKLDELIKSRFIEMFGEIRQELALNKLCNFIDYRGKTPEKSKEGLPFITARNVKMHYMSFETLEFISESTYKNVMTRGIPKEGDVLFTTEAPLGNVCRVPHFDTKFYIGQRIITMQPILMKAAYLEYALSSNEFKNKLAEKASGSTVTGIRSKLLEKLTIPVPPIELQNKFAEFVEMVEKNKSAIKNSLSSLETLKKSLMQKYFG